MKKLTVLILALLTLLLAGCADKTDDEPKAATPEELTALVYDELDTYLDPGADFDALVSFLDEWAKDNKLDGRKYDDGCYVIERSASKGAEKVDSMTMECSVGSDIDEEDMEKLSFLLYNACMTKVHPDMRAVICTENSERNIPAELLDSSRFINIKHGEDLALVNSSPAFSRFSLKKDIYRAEPQFTATYSVSISGLSGGKVEDLTEDRVNPIKVLSNILTSWKSSGNLYELAEFSGGISSDRYPSYARMTVSVPESDAESFEKKVNKQIGKTTKKVDEDESPDFSFVINRVLPEDRVLSEGSASDFIAMLYILSEGPKKYEEYEDIHAFISLGRVRLGQTAAHIEMRNYSMDEDLLAEMDDETVSLAEISEFNAERLSGGNIWTVPGDDPLQTEILASKNLDLLEGVSICPRIRELSPDTDCTCMVINSNKWKKADAIMEDLLSPKE